MTPKWKRCPIERKHNEVSYGMDPKHSKTYRISFYYDILYVIIQQQYFMHYFVMF